MVLGTSGRACGMGILLLGAVTWTGLSAVPVHAEESALEQVEDDGASEGVEDGEMVESFEDSALLRDDEEQARESRSRAGMEEIKVTGRKREELLSETPISIRAFNAAELEARSISRLDEIGLSTANMVFGSTIGSNDSARIYIRGVGQDDSRSIKDPGVGIYIDGIYLPRTAGGLLSIVDFASIEVLRGPQGTLFGKNTVGGVINIRTKEPGREYGGEAKLRVGNLGLLESQLTADIPLNFGPLKDKWFTRTTFATQTDDGYTTNLAEGGYDIDLFQNIAAGLVDPADLSGGNSGDNKLLGARFALLGEPAEDVRVDFTFDWAQEDERARIGECRLGDGLQIGRLVADNWTGFLENCDASNNAENDPDKLSVPPRQGWAEPQNKTDRDTWGTMGAVTWDVLDDLALKAIGSWRRRETDSRGGDFDWTPSEFLAGFAGPDLHQAFSAELDATGTAFDERLNYAGGFFFFRETGDSATEGMVLRNFVAGPDVADFRGRTSFTQTGIPITYEAFNTAIGGLAANDADYGIAQLNGTTVNDYDTNSYAVFAQASYLFFDALEATAGVRYTYEKKRRQGRVEPFLPTLDIGPGLEEGLLQEGDWDQWTPMAQLSYKWGDQFFYTQYARGWKSGGFNEAVRTQDEEDRGVPTGFDPEILDSIEVGWKGSFFDNKLNVNLAGFYSLYDDIQITYITSYSGVTAQSVENAADGRLGGFELELSGLLDFEWLPGPDAHILYQAGTGFISASYGSFSLTVPSAPIQNPLVDPPCESLSFAVCPFPEVLSIATQLVDPNRPFETQDYSDTKFVNTPDWNVNLALTYIFTLDPVGTFSLRGDYYWQDDVFFSPQNTAGTDSYGLLGFRIALDNDRWIDTTLAFWMKNVLDEVYVENGIDLGAGIGADQYYYGRPRSYGGEVIFRF